MKVSTRPRSYRVKRIPETIRAGTRSGHPPNATGLAATLEVVWRTRKKVVSILINESTSNILLAPADLRRLRNVASVRFETLKSLTESDARRLIAGADAVVTGWGTPQMTASILDHAPRLRLIAHAAGSVKSLISDDVWARGIRVTTAAPAIATSVAEFTLGMMIAGLSRAFPLSSLTREGQWPGGGRGKGLCGITIGIIGAGFVGRRVISLLRQFPVTILLHDPCLTAREASRLGTRKTTLERLAKASDVISLHAPSLPSTRHMMDVQIFRLMKPNVIFVNTSRGALVAEAALAARLRRNRDMQAFLDVTDPEPPARNNPLRKLANVVLTPHIAGFGANFRQGELAVTEIERFVKGQRPLYPVTREALARMA